MRFIVTISVMSVTATLGCSAPAPAVAPTRDPPPVVWETRDEILAKLTSLRGRVLETGAEDAQAWALVRRVARFGLLAGLGRMQAEDALGPSRRCGRIVPVDRAGNQWLCYKMGRLPKNVLGGTPILALAFNSSGTCVSSLAWHDE